MLFENLEATINQIEEQGETTHKRVCRVQDDTRGILEYCSLFKFMFIAMFILVGCLMGGVVGLAKLKIAPAPTPTLNCPCPAPSGCPCSKVLLGPLNLEEDEAFWNDKAKITKLLKIAPPETALDEPRIVKYDPTAVENGKPFIIYMPADIGKMEFSLYKAKVEAGVTRLSFKQESNGEIFVAPDCIHGFIGMTEGIIMRIESFDEKLAAIWPEKAKVRTKLID